MEENMEMNAKAKKPIYKKWWFWVIIAVLVIGVGGGSLGLDSDDSPGGNDTAKNEQTTVDEATADESAEEAEDYEMVEEPQIVTEDYMTYIVGTLKNNTDKTLSYSQVTFNLYDASGAQTDTALDNINNWEPGATWKFKAIILSPDEVASFKLMEVSGF